jgi:penicillin-binding protein 1A
MTGSVAHQSRQRRRLPLLLWGGLALVAAAGTAVLWLKAEYRAACTVPCADLGRLRQFAPNQTSVVYDVRGREIGRFLVEDRYLVRFGAIPPHVRLAFLAIEDGRFYQHSGVDHRRVIGALLADIRARAPQEGASTITMQLARNLYPELLPPRERTLARKLPTKPPAVALVPHTAEPAAVNETATLAPQ